MFAGSPLGASTGSSAPGVGESAASQARVPTLRAWSTAMTSRSVANWHPPASTRMAEAPSRSQVERLTILAPSLALAVLSPLAALADLQGDVPIGLRIVLLGAFAPWVVGLLNLQKWVIGRALTRPLVVAALVALMGNLFEGIGEQAGLKVGSSASLSLIGALVLVNLSGKPRWRAFQSGLLLLWAGVSAGLVYLVLTQMVDDVVTRLDEAVALLAVLGIMLISIATATRTSLLRPTRVLSFAGLLGLVAAAPILFVSEFWSVVAGTGFALMCGGLVHESLAKA